MAITVDEQKVLDEAKKAKIEADQAKIFYQEQAESFKFLSRTPGFPQSEANARMMKSLLAAKGLSWLAENLEAIWGDPRNRGKFSLPVAQAAPAAVEPEPIPEPIDPNGGISAAVIQGWDREEFKAAYADRRKRTIIDRVLREFSEANPGVDAAKFNRGGY
jgi:hypothetical protein